MPSLQQWVEERQAQAPTGSVQIAISRNKTDYLSGDPGEFGDGESTVTLSFQNPEATAFNGAVKLRLSRECGVEATALGQGWKMVKGTITFYDGNPNGGTIYYISVVGYKD